MAKKKEPGESLAKAKHYERAIDVYPQAIQLLDDILNEWYPDDLVDHQVTFEILFAYAARDKDGIAKGDALVDRGVAVDTVTDVANARTRAAGHPMVRITVDGERWSGESWERQVAWLHNAVHRVELKLDKEDMPEYDSAGKVLVKRRMPDAVLEVFWATMKRHKTASTEFRMSEHFIRNFNEKTEQYNAKKPIAFRRAPTDQMALESSGSDSRETASDRDDDQSSLSGDGADGLSNSTDQAE